VTGIPPAGSAEATWLKAGAAEVQAWGTDKTPSEAARPEAADTAAPGEPQALAPMFSDDLNIGNPLLRVPAADPSDFTSGPDEPIIAIPEVSIDAEAVAPEVRPCPTASAALDDDVEAVSDDSGEVELEDDVAADETACTALGIVAVLNCDTVCAPVPATVPAAWVTEAPAPTAPDGLVVVSFGAVKGAKAEAADDAPA
jgi:hypothetical protein